MHNKIIDISSNDLRKALPDVAWNATNDTFLAVWAAAPGMESTNFDYYVSGQRISNTGEMIGDPIEILKTGDILMLPRVVYNPNKNRFLVIYCRGEEHFNIRGKILDADGTALGEQFIVTDVPANQFHYTAAFNSRRNQFLITYNDFRDEVSNVYGVIIDDSGAVIKPEFPLCRAEGHQVNPVVCYNPQDDTWLINWEDFRAHGNSLESLGTLEVMTDIYGVLLSGDGTIMKTDIPMCADADGRNADQRFNGIAYNSKKNEFLASWTDTRDQIRNVAIVGRMVRADGEMPEEDFALVDAPGAQMVSHTHYVESEDAYFVAFECDKNDVDKFYFKDIKAKLDIGAQWLDNTGRPTGELIDIFSGEGNHRFVRFAYSEKSNGFLLIWQSDFPGVSDSVEGHIMSAGGDIMGALYKNN
jgi:hypothetical protein